MKLNFQADLLAPMSVTLGAIGGASSSDMKGVHSSLLSPSSADGLGLRGRSGLDERSEGRGSISLSYTSVMMSWQLLR